MSTQVTIAVCLFIFAFVILGLFGCLVAHQRSVDRMHRGLFEADRRYARAFMPKDQT